MPHTYTATAPDRPAEALNAYDQGYDAGWDGLYWFQNPHLLDGEITTEAAGQWERGRHDGRRDKRE